MGVRGPEQAMQAETLGCNTGLFCVPLTKGPLAAAKFGYCADPEEAKRAMAAMGAPVPQIKQPECGKACIVGAAVGGAILAALLVSAAWWFSSHRTRAK
jgi:hypothetical protein